MKNKKHLGQNFLTRDKYPILMAEAANVTKKDTVLEIGPGKGILTKTLLQKAGQVVSIEKDAKLVDFLKESFEKEIKQKNFILINDDIKKVNLQKIINGKYKLVANIPYYLTGEIIRNFLTTKKQPISITLMVQKEVAKRIVSKEKESLLSLSVKAYGEPKIIASVPAGNFHPKPKVDSAIIQISKISRKFFNVVKEEGFFEILHAGFSHKRKILIKNLGGFGKEKVKEIFEKENLDKNLRAEDVNLLTWKKITRHLSRGK